MRFIRNITFVLLIVLHNPLWGQDNPDRIFRDLTALEGTWFRPTDKGDILEIWSYQDDSTMTGRGIRIKQEDGDTVNLEYLTLKLRDEKITYTAQVRRQNDGLPIDFLMTQAVGNSYVFENKAHDYPQKIEYVLLDRREMIVKLEGERSGTGRTKTEEFLFTREFAASKTGFRVYGGANYSNLSQKGALGVLGDEIPTFGGGVGWDVGAQILLDGRGGFLTIAIDGSVSGRYNPVTANFTVVKNSQATTFERDSRYGQTWATIAVLPIFNLKREDKLSAFAGPFYSQLLVNRSKGRVLPIEDPTFQSTDDLKKSNFGITAGVNIGLNPFKKDLGGQLFIKGSLGLGNLDNLYSKVIANPTTVSGSVLQNSVQIGYSINLLKI